MSTRLYIVSNIELLSDGHYADWEIRITDQQHSQISIQDNTSEHYQWDTDTEQEATTIKNYFLEKGMRSSML